jgi:TPR repeat protein
VYKKYILKKGSVSAMNNLGNIYRSGIGTEVRIEEAKKYYKMAADKGDLCAMTNLAAVLLSTNPDEAFEFYL